MRKHLITIAALVGAAIPAYAQSAGTQSTDQGAQTQPSDVGSAQSGSQSGSMGSQSGASSNDMGNSGMRGGSMSGGQMQGNTDATGKDATAQMPADMFSNEMVLNKLHAVNQEEIQGAQMAKTNGDKMVQGYADKLNKDHTKADKDLMTLAQKKGVQIQDPMSANMPQAEKDKMQQHMAMMDQMKTMKGADFDKQYLSMMAKGHQEALDFLKQAETNVQDKDVKKFVTQLVPKIQEHKKMADELVKKSSEKVQGRR